LENLKRRNHMEDRRRWKNSKMDITEIGFEGADWINLAQDKVQ
jgi:hypothetical protein